MARSGGAVGLIWGCVGVIGAMSGSSVLAQGVATERELSLIQVSGERQMLSPNLPSSTFSIGADELAEKPLMNIQDALNYAPNVQIRKLRPGDPNGGLGGRSFGVGQPQRALVYVDGMLISNFLASHQVPRWSMVNETEVSRIDVLYGPFSAIYPGNSIGTTVAFTTRMPTKAEGSMRLQFYDQYQDDYGQGAHYRGNQQSLYAGDRWGRLAATVTYNRADGKAHGTSYATSSLRTANTGGTPVTGSRVDSDVNGVPRLIFGSTGESDLTTELFKLRMTYDLTERLLADVTLARFTSKNRGSARSYLRDASGAPVWSGNVLIDGATYTLPLMGPRYAEENHMHTGFGLKSSFATGWNGSVQWSRYRVVEDEVLTSNRAMDASAGVVPGTSGSSVGAGGGGTGWETLELQATYTPDANEKHALTVGYHRNEYLLSSRSYNLADWHDADSRTAETANYFGKTRIQALYFQDSWAFLPDWNLTAGLRYERFETWDGSQMFNNVNGGVPLIYPTRKLNASSPKLSLSRVLSDEWMAKLSYGHGTRFPTVAELYLGVRSGTEIVQNDPGLKPEKSRAVELSLLREQENASTRISLFEDDITDAIFSQRFVTGSGAVANVRQNVDRTRARGVEIAWQGRDFLVNGFDLQASAAYTHARILANDVAPASVGKVLPGVPKIRANLMGTWRQGDWTTTLGIRHQSRMYQQLDNSDTNPDTFGGSNSITVADAKLAYNVVRWATLSIGVNNLNNHRYYQTHPYAGRTWFLELLAKY